MRRIMIVIIALGAASLVQSANAGGSSGTCGRKQGHTLVQNGSARVYTLNGEVYACAIPGGASYHLGSASVCNGTHRAAPVAIADRLVAYGLQTCGTDTGSSVVVVRRLTTGKRLHTDPAITGAAGPESFQTVESLVVKRDGSDAWITVTNSVAGHGSTIEVHAHGTGGSALLDSGPGIDPSSLRLKRSRVSWLHDGHRRSAKLS
jgi:hypothetical protein